MKRIMKRFFGLALGALSLGAASSVQAALVPVPLSGFNTDVVANGTNISAFASTTYDLDGSNGNGYVFMAQGYTNQNGVTPTSFLPGNGILSSNATSGLSYNFASYTGNNSLRLPATGNTGAATGTLNFVTPQSAGVVYVLATSGGGPSTVTMTVNFTDGSNQVFTGMSVADWFGSSGTLAKGGLGRIARTATGTPENNTTNPKLWQIQLNLATGNYGKLISSITFAKTSTGTGALNVMAVSVNQACSGTPAAGTTVASVSSACTNTNIALSLSGASSDPGITYQWQASVDNGANWNSINGATNATYSVIGQTATAQYRAQVICSGSGSSGFSTPVTVTQNPFYNCYCTVTGTGTNEYIRSVSLNTLNNVTNANSSGSYGDFSSNAALTTTVNQGGSYTFSMEVRANNAGSQAGVWIDYNQNSTFEASEYFAAGGSNAYASNVVLSTILTIPNTALTGVTRMRVRWRNSGIASSDACTSGSTSWYGETEDYLITIDGPVACSGTPPKPTATPSVTEICPATSFSLTASGIPVGVSGFTYQWQSSPEGANTFTNLGTSQNSPNYTITSQNQSMDYRLVITCTNSGRTATSNPVLVELKDFMACYCAPTSTNGCTYGAITNVTLNGSPAFLSNASGCAATPYYTNFLASTATTTVNIGSTYTLGITLGRYSKAGVWIDYDHSGTFDVSEYTVIGSNSSFTSGNTVNLNPSITIPAGALTGQTKMRIRSQYNSSTYVLDGNSGCSTAYYGETEDYTITISPALACAGNPPATTATTTLASVCNGTSFSLSATGIPVGTTGLAFQWQSSPAGSNSFTNLGTSQTSLNYTITNQNAATDYRVILTCTNSGLTTTSSIISVSQNTFLACYCVPTGGSCTNEWIRGVTLNTLSNTGTTCSTGGYGDYSGNNALTTSLAQNATYSLALDLRINATVSQAGVWIDYDQSGTFDADEYTLLGTGPATGFATLNTTFNGDITIPATALTGVTRMRIRSNNGSLSSTQACLNNYFGEVEDYLVTITPPVVCTGTPTGGTAIASVTTTCGTTAFTLQANGYTTGASGLSFQWQKSPSGGNNYADINGATSANYTVTSQTNATDYRLKVTCASSGVSGFSTVATVNQNAFLNCYCTPSYSSGGANDNITSVKIGTMTNTSTGNASPYYRDYTTQQPGTIAVPELVVGATSNVVLTFGSDGNQHSAVWIDFNHNGTFDATEYFTQGTNAGASGTATIAVAVPNAALTGQTRIRVRGGHDSAINSGSACTAGTYGEAEDYLVNLIAPVACSGNPPAVVAASSVSNICSGSSFTLSATGIASNVTGMSYQWQSKVGSAAYTNLGTAQASATYLVSAQTATTFYRLLVTCTASNKTTISNAFTVTQNSYANCYCVPTGGSCTNEYIRGVKLNTLNNAATTCTSGGYANFTGTAGLTTSLGLGSTYTIELDLRINATVSQAAVWIDYDHSGTFDANEYKLIGTGPAANYTALNTTFTNTITIPTTALTGPTRMRVRSNNGSISSAHACLNNYFGEVEDYLVTITQSNLVISNTAPIPAGSYHDITVTSTGVATLAGPVTATGSVKVQSGGSFSDDCQLLSGTGSFTLEAGATIFICNPAGIVASGANGAIRLTGTRSFSRDASYIYNGTAAQATGTGIPVSVQNLTIENPAGVSLSKATGVQRLLTLNGNLSTNGNTFTLLSNATGTAMVVNAGGVVNGTATVQRFIDPSLNAGTGYRHFSSPVVSTTVSDLATAGFSPVVNPAYNTAAKPSAIKPFPTVFAYNQARLNNDSARFADFGFGWESPSSLSSALTPGKGYTFNITANRTVDFSGTLNNGNVTVTGLGRGATAESGWHLLGNPYPSPIDWDNLTLPAGMMDAVYSFRSSSAYNGSYASYVNGVGSLTGGIIPAMQAFFVRTTALVSSFSFSNAARLTSYQNPSFYRTTETRPLLQLSASKGLFQDEAFVYLQQGATAGENAAFDAFSIPMGAVRIYTLAGTSQLSINGLGFQNQQVPLVVEGAAGSYELKVEQLLNQMQVQLEDKQLNTFQTLTPATIYAFTHTGGSTASRFVLHLGARISGMAETAKGMEVKLYPNPSQGKFQLQLSGLKASTAQMTITDLAGKTIYQQQLKASNGSFSESIELKAAKGVYLLQLKVGQQVVIRKVIVE